MSNESLSAEEMLKKIEYMNSLGPRLTGNEAHKKFIKYLKSQVKEIGFKVYSDPYFFERWEEKRKALVIHGCDGDEEISVSSAFPYSGETTANGVTAELEYVKEKHIGYLAAKDKIAVIKIGKIDFLPSKIAFDKRNAYPTNVDLPRNYEGPVATAFINFPFLNMAKLAGVKGIICIWQGVSDECVQGQYLPFILDYQGIPALWINETDGIKVIEAAENHMKATLTLEAEIESLAQTETFYTIIKGTNKHEAVIVNTHTDGTNCIEENGSIAMLEMLKQLKDKKLNRTHIFVFATGHFRLPYFKNASCGGMQATSTWLAAHRDLWDGKRGHIKAVAGVSVEHLGCQMWKDEDGQYKKVNDVETEICYTGNEAMDEVYYKSLKGRKKVRTLTLRGHNFLHFGEGQPLFNVGIPEIALVTAPDCLCVVSDSNEMEKFDVDLMAEQTGSFIKMLELLEDMSKRAVGKCDKYSLVIDRGLTRRLFGKKE